MNPFPVLMLLARSSAQAAVLVGVILIVQWLFRRQLTPGWRCALWLPLIVRLPPGRIGLINAPTAGTSAMQLADHPLEVLDVAPGEVKSVQLSRLVAVPSNSREAFSPSPADSAAPSPTSGKEIKLKVSSLTTVDLPGPPFGVIATADGRNVFVSLAAMRNGAPMGIAVLKADQGRLQLDHTVPLSAVPTEMVLTHDGKSVIAAAGDKVLVLDTERLIAGKDPEEAAFSDGASAGAVFVNVTADDQTLFVSNERSKSITVVNLASIRSQGFSPNAILGKIPVGLAPIALTFSPDEHWLFTTSEGADRSWGWPAAVPREGVRDSARAPKVPEGAIIVVDVAKARTDPAHSVVARVPAGGSPVRLALSAAGDRLYVTARNSNAVLVFDPEKLRIDQTHARIGTVPVGSSPVPLILVDGGRKLLVGNSNRFAQNGGAASTITVIATTQNLGGAGAVLGTLPSGGFPREFRLLPDGHTLLLTNFASRSLQVMSVDGDLTK